MCSAEVVSGAEMRRPLSDTIAGCGAPPICPKTCGIAVSPSPRLSASGGSLRNGCAHSDLDATRFHGVGSAVELRTCAGALAGPSSRCELIAPRRSQSFHVRQPSRLRSPCSRRRCRGGRTVPVDPRRERTGSRARATNARRDRAPAAVVETPRCAACRRASPIEHPVRAWRQAGTRVPAADDLVGAADFLVARRRPFATREELRHEVTVMGDRAGRRALERALADVRAGLESRRRRGFGSILTRAGLPEPELNWDLRDAAGRSIARLDLAYPAVRVGVE